MTASEPDGDVPKQAATNLPVGATFTNQAFKWTPGDGTRFTPREVRGLRPATTLSSSTTDGS